MRRNEREFFQDLARTESLFKGFIYTALILTISVIIIGVYTRLKDAGLGCPDWPTCFGQILVPSEKPAEFTGSFDTTKAWIEMFHRYAAMLLGLLIFVIFAFSLYTPKSRKWLPHTGILVLLVIAQGALGALTVTMGLAPGIVMAHLIGGFSIASLLTWIALKVSTSHLPHQRVSGKNKIIILVFIKLLTLQIALGGWTSSNYAALACGNHFPTCLGQWWPEEINLSSMFIQDAKNGSYEFGVLDNNTRAGIHMAHRVGALVLTLFFIFLLTNLYKYHFLKMQLGVITTLFTTQIALGIGNVIFTLPLFLAVAHNATGLFLLLTTLILWHKANWRRI